MRQARRREGTRAESLARQSESTHEHLIVERTIESQGQRLTGAVRFTRYLWCLDYVPFLPMNIQAEIGTQMLQLV